MINRMKRKVIAIGGLRIGEGRPKICVPLTGQGEEALLQQLKSLKEVPFDMVEWRLDYFSCWRQEEKRLAMSAMIRSYLGEKPLLLTFRTRREGGEREIEASEYEALCLTLSDDPSAELIDLEYCSLPETKLRRLVEEIHRHGKYAVGSSHDFAKVPEIEEMIRRLRGMQELDMDITKIAVMPHDKMDTLRLLQAAVMMEQQYADRPCVTIAMGSLGAVSRVAGFFTGSAVTFGSAGVSSAPGQYPAGELRQILDLLGEG